MKDIAGYEGLYAITSCGKVWSHSRKKFRKLKVSKHGYLTVILLKSCVAQEFYVHRLVAQAYIDNPDNLPVVIHKDGNRANNCVNNLEWVILEDTDDHDIRRTYENRPVYCVELNKTFGSIKEASRETNLSNSHIGGVCKGRLKTAGGYHWKFV